MDLSHKPTITGKKITLRPFTREDLPAIKKCLTDPEVIELTGSSGDFDENIVTTWYLTRNEQTERLDLAIESHASNQVIGEVVVNEYDEQLHSMNFRIMIGSEGRNKGFGKEALALLADYMFVKTPLSQLTLSVLSINHRALHIYEQAGFLPIATEKTKVNGQYTDEILMVLSRKNWLEKNK
ncbi:GNAT family N-acetyltransferase [Jeotgalibacillus terrae]|uniref:GNAT family N-acetyltransferase n=1 Tax=Jeotgalibacillus terrae TaxID=587735 RepID=A0ABW5ZK35_9BACL|nr:GNAT family protein [Jeotgalibacillus terrae]MBM7578693.1 diamine N-acetyltransferase [Jeotgalibacillus terrae]